MRDPNIYNKYGLLVEKEREKLINISKEVPALSDIIRNEKAKAGWVFITESKNGQTNIDADLIEAFARALRDWTELLESGIIDERARK